MQRPACLHCQQNPLLGYIRAEIDAVAEPVTKASTRSTDTASS
jgi:hypothetical protein